MTSASGGQRSIQLSYGRTIACVFCRMSSSLLFAASSSYMSTTQSPLIALLDLRQNTWRLPGIGSRLSVVHRSPGTCVNVCGISRVLSAAEAGEGHLSGTAIADGLERPTRDSDGAGSPSSPIWPCSEWGLPCDLRLRKPGALLPHPFTLACAAAPKSGRPSAVYSLWHFPSPFAPKRSGRPGVTRHPALWSSDFPPPEPPRWPDGDPHFAHYHTNLDEKSGATGAGSPIVISWGKAKRDGMHPQAGCCSRA